MTIKENKEEIEKIVNSFGYKLIKDYIPKGKARRVVIEDEIGYMYDVFLYNLKLVTPSPFHENNPHTLYNISVWLKSKNSEFELCEDNKYNGSNNLLLFFHNSPLCEEYFYMSWSHLSKHVGCPVCSGRQVGERTSLAYLRPDLVKEWHEENLISPEDVTLSSNKKVYWVCSKCGYGNNKEWNCKIQGRTSGNTGCPACVGKVVTDKNRLSVLYPEISKEWHPTKNRNLTPDGISYGSRKKAWWLCSDCEHEWCTSVSHRTIEKTGCPSCSLLYHESKMAIVIKKYIKEIYSGIGEYKIFKNPQTGRWLPYDIYIPYGKNPELNGFYIEIHGEQHYELCTWHKRAAWL